MRIPSIRCYVMGNCNIAVVAIFSLKQGNITRLSADRCVNSEDIKMVIWCKNDVVSTSMRRDDVVSTLIRRHFYVMCPLGYYFVLNC